MDFVSLKFEYYPKLSSKSLEESVKAINANKGKWDKPFFVDTKTYLDMGAIKKVLDPFLTKELKNIIVLGTGGSIQTLLALKHLANKKIFPVASSRAVELKGCLDKTSANDSVVIPISRGGETIDINSTIGVFAKKGYKFLGLSTKGAMFEILKKLKCPILDVPDLSGRFAGSVSTVGIVPAYLAGINVQELIKGLDESYKIYMNYGVNPALEFASFLYALYNKGYKVAFSMPYSKNLEGSVGLFTQELSESTGKNDKGLLSAYQSAPICQHSVLEYLLGGSKGVVVPLLWTLEKELFDLMLESSIDYVNGQTAQTIVNYQADATFQALLEQSVPSAKIIANSSTERDIGQLIALIQTTVYYLCVLLGVNWADNPKVVIGKKICNEALKSKLSSKDKEKAREKIANEKFKQFFA